MPTAAPASALAVRLSAALAALVFAVHPLRVESVAWVTERRDVHPGLFYLLAVWAYLHDAEAPLDQRLRRRPWYWVSLSCFVLALLSKAITMTLPLILVVLDVYPLRRLGQGSDSWWSRPARRRWAEKIPFVLASRRWPAAGAVWLVYVVTLLPVSGVFQNGPQISADRYSYLPSLSLALITGAAGLGAWRVWTGRRHGRAPGFCLTGAGFVLVTALTLLTWQQIEIWHDSERLWTHAVSLTPSWMAHLQLGNVRRQQARLAEANEHYRQASSMRPDAPDVLIQWGVALAQQGRLAEALDRFTGALRLRPDSGAAHYNWGNAVLAAGDVEEAIAHYREAVRLEPQGAEAY